MFRRMRCQFHGRQVIDTFFKQVIGDETKVRTAQSGSGFINFLQHVSHAHSNEYKDFLSDYNRTGGINTTYAATASQQLFYSKRAQQITSWIDLTVNGLQPSAILQNPVFVRNINYDQRSHNTLVKYIAGLTKRVESKISHLFPDRFALIFDGWSTNSTHYVCLCFYSFSKFTWLRNIHAGLLAAR